MAAAAVSEVGGRGVHLAVVSRELYTKLDAPTARLPNPYIGEIEGTVHTFHGMVASFARRPALFATTFLGAATGPGDVGATDAADAKTEGGGKAGAGGTAGAAGAAAAAEGARCRRQARVLEAQLEAAAAAIRSATHLLVAVGAGFSADGTGGSPGGLTLGVAGGAGGGRGTDGGAGGDAAAAAAAASSASADATAAGYGIVQEWMEGKDGFVYTSNVDRRFLSSGFDPARLYEMHGDAHTWQCSVPCGGQTFDRFGRPASRPASAEGDSVAGVVGGA